MPTIETLQNHRRLQECIRKAQERAGKGWSLLSEEMQEALIASELVRLIYMTETEHAGALVDLFCRTMDS